MDKNSNKIKNFIKKFVNNYRFKNQAQTKSTLTEKDEKNNVRKIKGNFKIGDSKIKLEVELSLSGIHPAEKTHDLSLHDCSDQRKPLIKKAGCFKSKKKFIRRTSQIA